jgi:hypothetical protein
MSTTALFVELLVIGLETLIWLALLVSSLFGLDWVSHMGTAFEKAGVFATVAMVSLAYLVGIIVDEICDSLIEPWATRIRSSVQEEDQPEMWDMQAYVFTHSEEATAQLGYMRSRLRILRSSIFNIALIGVFALIFLWTRAPVARSLKPSLTWFISIAGLVTVGLTLFVYWRITLSYWLRARSIYRSFREQTSEESKDT